MTDDLDGCRRQMDKVEKQIRELQRGTRANWTRQLPPGGGPLDARLLAAEEYVKQLEELTPLETKRQLGPAAGRGGEGQVGQGRGGGLRDARDQWREALRTANLPPSLTPEHVQHLVEGNDQTLELGRRLQVRREELQQRQTELAAVISRINALFDDAQLTAASEDPRTRLRQLAAALAEQTRWIERRREMRKEHRDLKQPLPRARRAKLRKLAQQRRVLLNQANVGQRAATAQAGRAPGQDRSADPAARGTVHADRPGHRHAVHGSGRGRGAGHAPRRQAGTVLGPAAGPPARGPGPADPVAPEPRRDAAGNEDAVREPAVARRQAGTGLPGRADPAGRRTLARCWP